MAWDRPTSSTAPDQLEARRAERASAKVRVSGVTGFSWAGGEIALRPVGYTDKAAGATGNDSKDRCVSAAIRLDAAADTRGRDSHYRQDGVYQYGLDAVSAGNLEGVSPDGGARRDPVEDRPAFEDRCGRRDC